MVRKTVTQLRDSRFVLAESDLAEQIGRALREELGATRRATKTVMRWASVSDTTARAWLQGRASPSGLHLIALAAQSRPVMFVLLKLTGYGELEVGLNLLKIEANLTQALTQIRAMTGKDYRRG